MHALAKDPEAGRKRDRRRRVVGSILAVASAVCGVSGAYLVGAYAWGVVDVLDEPDQSWIFWGLAILFIGIGALTLGGILALGSWALMRRDGSGGNREN